MFLEEPNYYYVEKSDMRQHMEQLNEAYNIFHIVFGAAMSKEQFERKHFGNPQKLDNPIRFYYEEGQAAGINAFMGSVIIADGEKHWVAQSNDTAVLPEFRGRHIFTKIITAEEDSHNEEFIFGIPNGNSYPGFLKMGWTQKCEFTHYVRIINPIGLLIGSNAVSNALRRFCASFFGMKRLSAQEKIEKSLVPDFSDVEIKAINDSVSCAVERTNEYFQWKLSNRVDQPMFLKLYDGDRLLGYILYHVKRRGRGKSAVIDDFGVMVNGEDEKIVVMKKMLHQLANESDMIDNPLVNPNSVDADIMRQSGMYDFRKIKSNYQCQPLLVSNAGKDAVYMQGFQMRYVDFDVFLNA